MLELVEDGSPVDILFMDFRKALKSVSHYRLLTKMKIVGTVDKTLEIIIIYFLGGRSCFNRGTTGVSVRTLVVGYLSMMGLTPQWRNVACWHPSAPTATPFLTPPST